jgi:hypothetical protein
MVYKHFQNNNYEDFSSGRVIYHKSNYSNYSVRLVGEVFYRCLEHSKKKNEICLYDPCCGSAYMLTVLGYLFNETIETIYCSDISNEAVELSRKNLSLLSYTGIEKRRNELNNFIRKYNKDSHRNALHSLEKIEKLIKHEIKNHVFEANILNENELINKDFIANVILTDVPYGNLINWSGNNGGEIENLLDGIIPIIDPDTIIAISHNKKQKITNLKYKIIEKIQIGHREIGILKLQI